MHDTVRVLYDLSLVASSGHRPSARTGILRVVEKVAHSLAERPDCTICFTSSGSLAGLIDYLENNPRLPSNVPHSSAAVTFSRAFDPLREFVWKSALNRNLAFRALRRAAVVLSETLEPRITSIADAVRNRFSIIHSPSALLAPWAKADRHLRKVVTIYDLIAVRNPEYFSRDVWRFMEQRVLECQRSDTWCLAISQATKDELCSVAGISPEKVFVTPLAAGSEFRPERDRAIIAAALERYKITAEPYLLSVCTLEPRKNLHSVIAAFAEVVRQEKIGGLQLVLIGNVGWTYDRIFSESKKYPELRDRIIFTGFVPDEDLRAIYSGALAFLYLSVAEGFGLPPLEAMQCGAPTITSNVSSLPEVVGDAAVQVPPLDLDAIGAAILHLYSDEAARTHYAAAGLERARDFSWERCAEKNGRGLPCDSSELSNRRSSQDQIVCGAVQRRKLSCS